MPEARGDVADRGVLRRLDDVTEALQAMVGVLEQAEDLSVVLGGVCGEVVRAVPGADLASVTVLHEGRPETAALTGQDALAVDEAQYRSEQGPCLEAARTRRTQRVSAPRVRELWPAFARASGGLGVESFLSVPLLIDAECRGSLNLYSRRSDGFSELDAALLELFTTAAEAALHNASRYLQARKQVEQFRRTLTSRPVIDQAKGILMAVHKVPAEEAFAMLVQRSQQENVKLRDLAERFVSGLLTPEG